VVCVFFGSFSGFGEWFSGFVVVFLIGGLFEQVPRHA